MQLPATVLGTIGDPHYPKKDMYMLNKMHVYRQELKVW